MEPSLKEQIKTLQTLSQQQERTIESSLKLVDRLGVLAKGNSRELDNKLTKLRKSAKQNVNNEQVYTQIQTALTSAADLQKQQSDFLKELRDTMLVSGEALQASKGLDTSLRRQLRVVVNNLKSQDSFVFRELQPLIISLLGIFQSSKNGNGSNAILSTNKPSTIDEGILSALIAAMKKLSSNDIIKPRLSEFNQRINIARDESEQLDLCLKFFDEVVVQFGEEYRQTQKLIVSINSALEDVHQTLLQSLKSSKNYGDQLQKLDVKIDKQITELSKNAEKATSVDQLQNIIDKKLNDITLSIKERDGIEKKRTLELDTTLQEMESKLTKLEKRTEYYRNKWLEEKTKSDTDALTGLPNRGAYDKRFSEEFKRWLRKPEPLCLAVIDIDHFKKINDKYGHSVGDKTLQIVSQTMRKNLRVTDYLARYGGEEFVCLMLNTDPKDVLVPLEKIRSSVERTPFKVKDDRLNITISIGVTMFRASDNVHTVFDRADKALYEAKDTGRNKICYKK